MKFLAMRALAVVLYSGVAMGQVQSDTPDAAPPPEMKLITGNEARHARDADARHCLTFKTDLQIIRCAEKYRYIRPR